MESEFGGPIVSGRGTSGASRTPGGHGGSGVSFPVPPAELEAPAQRPWRHFAEEREALGAGLAGAGVGGGAPGGGGEGTRAARRSVEVRRDASGLRSGRTVEFYKYVNDDLADARSKDWPLVGSPWPVLAITLAYTHFCLRLGPRLMRDRQPFDVDRLIVAFDLFQILACGWMTVQGFYYFPGRYKFFCEPIDYSNEEYSLYAVHLAWLYYMLKILDLLDTVFFVLRKKTSQITFLHVYHHAIMIFTGYIAVKYVGGGHFILLGHLNSFVHTVMYTYYLITNIRPEYKRSIWWKKHITQLQIAQFLTLFVQNFPTLFWDDCDIHFAWRLALTVQVTFMTLMFLDFYRRAYRAKSAD
ncbi:very long chain fatty acid elongase AAEL008004-like [Bacillus rossius redtenbacheri]|uniref:very long chain fatty acid elongase AAEL008004-like n=1 Tax=Bacillus rossius redtenbacheri TaxID=93214 RepID=UPI002FDD68DA